MNYNSVYYPTPEDFLSVAEEIESDPTIILSGPKIKQDAVYHNSNDFEVIQTLLECTRDYDKPVIIDDFYLCYMQYKESDNEKHRSAFEQLVTKETTYLATRIYSFQWMLKNENVTQQFNLQTVDLINLCYRKDEAIHKCRELNPNIEDEIIQKHIEQTLYETSLDVFDDVIDYQSYIPRVLTTVIETDASSSILPSQVQDLIGTSFAHSNIAGALMDLQEKIPKSITSDAKRSINRVLPSVLGATAISTGLYHFVIPLTIYWNFIRGNDERRMHEFFGELLSDDMLPHSREKLEEESGLPPRTIETLQNVTHPQILADISTSVEHNQLDAAELIDEVYENSEQIEELEQIGKSLSERIQPLEEHYNESINTALRSYSEIVNYENERMKSILTDELEYSKEHAEEILDSLSSLNLRENEVENVRNNLRNASIALIRGPIGIGKSQFIYDLSDKMAKDGKTVKYCSTDNIADLRTGLKQFSSEDRDVVLIYEYRSGNISPGKFRRIFGQNIYELYDKLVIECKESSYHEFKRVWEEASDTGEQIAANRLQPQDNLNIELDGLTTVKPIPRSLGVINNSVLESIETIYEGNPLVAFEASILALSGENWETGLGKRDILRQRLKDICAHFEESAPSDVEPAKLLRSAAITGTVDDLASIPVIAGSSERGRSMEFIRTYMKRYIVDEGDHWRLTPDYIRRILFKDTWFKTGEEQRLNDHRLDYIRRIKENNAGFDGCAANIGESWHLSNQAETSISEELVMEAVSELLDNSAETRSYSGCLLQFAMSGVPLDSSILQQHIYEWSDNWINPTNKSEEGFKILSAINITADNSISHKHDLQEFFDLAEIGHVFITYMQNSQLPISPDNILIYYLELINTYIERRIPDVAGNDDKMEAYVQKLEEIVDEFADNCIEQTDHEYNFTGQRITDEDIQANLYTLTISSLMVRFDPDEIEGHIHYFMNRYKDCYTDEEKRSDYQLYSRIIVQLALKTSVDHGEQWLKWIPQAQLQRGGLETPIHELGETYMRFKAYCIISLFNFTMKDAYRSDEVVNIDPSQRLVEWWIFLLNQRNSLLAIYELISEHPELRESTEWLFGFIHDGIPYLGEKYGFGEEAEEIVSKRFEEIRERYPDALEDR